MSYMTDITAAIAGLDKWRRAAVATACARSVSPVVVRFAQPATRHDFDQGLDAAWTSVRDGAADSRVMSARAALENLPESTCDNSNIPAYEVMIALSILSYALDTIIQDDSNRWARYACTGAADYYGGYDNVLARGNQVRTIDPRNPPPPGRLESLQIQSQLRSIEGMRDVTPLPGQIVEEMRASAAQVAAELDRALPAYAERRNWSV